MFYIQLQAWDTKMHINWHGMTSQQYVRHYAQLSNMHLITSFVQNSLRNELLISFNQCYGCLWLMIMIWNWLKLIIIIIIMNQTTFTTVPFLPEWRNLLRHWFRWHLSISCNHIYKNKLLNYLYTFTFSWAG